MSHVRVSQSLNLRFGVFTVLLFHTVLLGLIHPCRGQHRVISPSKLKALVGEDIILPSLLDPPVNTFSMTVEWTRPDLDPRFVLVWRDGGELESKKHPSYVGRASVFIDELKRGNVSLKLSKVKISDGGTYRCFIPEFNIDSTVQLVVGSASSPVVHMTRNSSAVVVQCESKGWYPEPEVSWLDGERNVLSAGPAKTVRGPDGLYTVSSRVTVEKRHNNNFTCRVQQKDINQTRETQIHVPDHFFVVASTPSTPGPPGAPGTSSPPGTSSTPGTSSPPGTSSTPGPPVSLSAIFVCAAFFLTVVFLVWKIWRQKRLRNKRRDLEDGAEQTDKEKTIASKSDDTRFQVMKEEEGESVPLMARREEENNLDNTGQEEIQSYSEHKDPKSVAEEETNQDQMVTKPELQRDKDSAEGEVEIQSINNEKAALISTEGETHQRQDMTGGQVKSDLDKDEGEQKMKPAKEDSGPSVVVVAEEQTEQLQNLLTDQNAQKEKETRQEQVTKERSPKNCVDKKKAKSKETTAKKAKEQEGATTEDWSLAQKKKQQRQMEEEGQRLENKGTLEPELQGRKEKEAIELKSQSQDGDKHLLENQEQKGDKAEIENKKEKGREGNQRNFTHRRERKAKNQKEQVNEKLREKEHKLPLLSKVEDRLDRKIHQETGGRKTQELQEETQQGKHFQKYQDEAKEQPEQSTKDINAECQERREEKTDKGAGVDEAQKTSKEMEKQGQLQAVQQTDVKEKSREQPENFKVLAEKGTGCLEVLQEKNASAPTISESSKRNQRAVTPIHQERQEKGTDKEAGVDETPKTPKEMEKQGQLLAVQQPYVKQESKEQPQNTFKVPAEKGTDCLEELQKRLMKTDTRKKQQCKQDKESHVDQQQKSRKRRHGEEDSEQRQETLEKRIRGELNEDQIMHEPQELDENSQMDVEPVCPEDQQMPLSLNPQKEGKSYLQDQCFADVDMSQ